MNVLLTGASGLIGKAIKAELIRNGNTVYPLIRNKRQGPFFYIQENDEIFLDSSIRLDAVINLAGVNISDRRWSHTVKDQIIQSRVQTTSTLSSALASLEKKPDVYLSASAIGYYGADSNSTLCESSPTGNDFLARLAADWEKATEPAKAEGIRTCLLRLGLVDTLRASHDSAQAWVVHVVVLNLFHEPFILRGGVLDPVHLAVSLES